MAYQAKSKGFFGGGGGIPAITSHGPKIMGSPGVCGPYCSPGFLNVWKPGPGKYWAFNFSIILKIGPKVSQPRPARRYSGFGGEASSPHRRGAVSRSFPFLRTSLCYFVHLLLTFIHVVLILLNWWNSSLVRCISGCPLWSRSNAIIAAKL